MSDFSRVVSELKTQTVALNKLAGIVEQQGDEIEQQGKDARRVAAGQKAYQTRLENQGKMTDAGEVEDQKNEENRSNRLINAVLKTRDGILGVGSTFTNFAKDKGKQIGGDIFGMLKKFAFGAAIAGVLALLNSQYWEDIKTTINDSVIPALKTLYDDYVSPFFTSIGNISTSFKNMLEDPSWENISAFFGDTGTIALGIGALVLLLAPFKTLSLATKGIGLAITGFRAIFSSGGSIATGLDAQGKRLTGNKFLQGLRSGIGKLKNSFTSLGNSLTGAMGRGAQAVGRGARGAGSAVARAAGGATRAAGGLARGAAVAAKGALRFAGPIGLVATAAFGIFDGVRAGLEEAKNENATAGSIVKESVAGLLSGLTFGLVEQKTISDGITTISTGITEAWDTTKTAISNGASTIATKTTEAFDNAKTAFTDGFESVKAGINKVVTDPEGAFNAATSKISELTGITLPDFQQTKEGLANLGTNIKERASAIKGKFEDFTGIELPSFSIPTFEDLKAKGNSLFDSLLNIELPEFTIPSFGDLKDKASGLFDNLKAIELPEVTLPTLPDLKEKFSGIWDSLSIPEVSFPDFSNLNPFANFSKRLEESEAFDKLNFSIFGREFGFGDKLKDSLKNLFGVEAREMGGPVERGEDYVVGEAGPELFLPRGSGYIIPNATMARLRTGAIAQGSVQREETRTPAPIVINAPSTTNNVSSGGGGRGGLIPMQVGDNDPTLRAIVANPF